jgi:putative phosphoesterase
MKIGIISDIHGNVVSLEKILKYFKNNNVECIVHLGDAIGIGPFPIETLDLLNTLDNCEMILGNHENYQITKFPEKISESEFKHQNWVKSLLTEKYLNWIKTFPKIIYKDYNGKSITFLHSIYNNIINDFTDIPYLHINELEDYFKDIKSDIIFYGHSHFRQINRRKKEFCNPGSSGCSKNNETQFILLTIDKNVYSLENICIEYNKKLLLEEYKVKNVPGREEILNIFY